MSDWNDHRWEPYGFTVTDEIYALPGWTDLDRLNEKDKVTRSILERYTYGKETAIKDTAREALDKTPLALRHMPLVAWLLALLVLHRKIDLTRLSNLNYIEFATRILRVRLLVLAQRAGAESLLDALRLAVLAIAADMITNHRTEFEHAQIVHILTAMPPLKSSGNDRDDRVRQYTQALIDMGLLQTAKNAVALSSVDPLQLGFPPVWQAGYYIASTLHGLEAADDTLEARLDEQLSSPLDTAYLAGVIEFLIVRAHDIANRKGSQHREQTN